MTPHYLPSTVDYCERCRCKTWHVVLPSSGERVCEWHLSTDARDEIQEARRAREAEAK